MLPSLSLTVKLSLYALYNLSRLYEYVTVEFSVALAANFSSFISFTSRFSLLSFFTVMALSDGKPLVGALSSAVTFITIVLFE